MAMTDSINIIGLTLDEMEMRVESFGYERGLAREVMVWAYRGKARDLMGIRTIPVALRRLLSDGHQMDTVESTYAQVSADGTTKHCFLSSQGHPYEAAYMPGGKRNTLCVSTQSGCRMGCSFCHTGSMGFRAQLSANEILSQLLSLPQRAKVNRIVLMGMGEPLDNFETVIRTLSILNADWGLAFGASNITLSTVGLMPELLWLISKKLCNIAISLHSPWPEERAKLVPAEREAPIAGVVEMLRANPVAKPLRLSFEYVVIPGVNSSQAHAKGVFELLRGIPCHLNVIPLSEKGGKDARANDAGEFQTMLNKFGQPATLRESRGLDIDAACGMLAAKIQGE